LPGGIDISAYRIIQEGLTNVLRHAGATEAVVSLDYAPDHLGIEVRDDGRAPPRTRAAVPRAAGTGSSGYASGHGSTTAR